MTPEARALKHIIRNSTGGIAGLVAMYCKGCRLEDGRSVPEEVKKHLVSIEQAVTDYVSDKKPRGSKLTPDSS